MTAKEAVRNEIKKVLESEKITPKEHLDYLYNKACGEKAATDSIEIAHNKVFCTLTSYDELVKDVRELINRLHKYQQQYFMPSIYDLVTKLKKVGREE